jgi:hypothetical protein
MENLVPREAYDLDETGYRKRLPIVVGLIAFLFGGVGFGLLFPFLFEWVWALFLPLPARIFNASTVIISGLGFGIFFGLVMALRFPAISQRKMTSIVDDIYAGDAKIVQPPSGKEFSYRLPCSWMRSNNFAVGGVLYLSKESFMFVPHKKNLPQHREPFEIAPLNNATFSLVEPRVNLLSRFLTERPPRLVAVKWRGEEARFSVPEAEVTLMKIKSIIESA